MNRRKFLVVSGCLAALSATQMIVGCSDSWIATAEEDMPEIENIISTTAVVVTDATGNGVLNAEIGLVLKLAFKTANATLAIAKAAIDAYNASPTGSKLSAVIAALQTLNKNLHSILAVTVTNPNLAAIINSAAQIALNITVTVLQLIEQHYGVSTSDVIAHPIMLHRQPLRGTSTAIKLPSRREIHNRFQDALIRNGFQNYAKR